MTTRIETADEHNLREQDGNLTRWQGQNCVEIWGQNIAEHYLITFDETTPHRIDIVYIPAEHNRVHW